MTVTSLRSHIADVLAKVCSESCASVLGEPDKFHTDEADALLADPTLAAIIDLAASHVDGTFDVPPPSPEVRALLRQDREPQPSDGPDYHADHAAWRATVEEREFAKRVELND